MSTRAFTGRNIRLISDACVKVIADNRFIFSGLVISNDGYILTSGHATANREDFDVWLMGESQPRPATLIESVYDLSTATDFAVLKVDAPPHSLPAPPISVDAATSRDFRFYGYRSTFHSFAGAYHGVVIGRVAQPHLPDTELAQISIDAKLLAETSDISLDGLSGSVVLVQSRQRELRLLGVLMATIPGLKDAVIVCPYELIARTLQRLNRSPASAGLADVKANSMLAASRHRRVGAAAVAERLLAQDLAIEMIRRMDKRAGQISPRGLANAICRRLPEKEKGLVLVMSSSRPPTRGARASMAAVFARKRWRSNLYMIVTLDELKRLSAWQQFFLAIEI